MKPIFNNPHELASYFDFAPMSMNDNIRLAKAWQMYITDYKGDGCMGCVAEILTATTNSKKCAVSNAGRNDCFIKYRSASGAVIPVWCERKTNGGRTATIETEYSKAEQIIGKFVVYSLDICNKSTSYLRRRVPAVVIPRVEFINKLIEFNAIKEMRHKGKLDGYGIQSSSKQWFVWLSEYPIVYDRNAIYSDDDFEGLF